VIADGSTTSAITVTLKDANNNLVSGKTVTLAQGAGHSTITTVNGTTNGSGQASFTVKDSTAEAVTYTATDTTDSVTHHAAGHGDVYGQQVGVFNLTLQCRGRRLLAADHGADTGFEQ
jgi:hypothetical protein